MLESNITIHGKQYKVTEIYSTKEKEKGLMNRTSLPENEGMLFCYDPPEDVSFWMKNTLIPLDIVFINEDLEVISVAKGVPNSRKPISESQVSYVLEVNTNSGIKRGDELEFEDDSAPEMKVLAPDGTTLYTLAGGERIFSRKNTKILIKKAKKADLSQDDRDYKALGKYMFKCIRILDNRDPEYVSLPESKE